MQNDFTLLDITSTRKITQRIGMVELTTFDVSIRFPDATARIRALMAFACSGVCAETDYLAVTLRGSLDDLDTLVERDAADSPLAVDASALRPVSP